MAPLTVNRNSLFLLSSESLAATQVKGGIILLLGEILEATKTGVNRRSATHVIDKQAPGR